MIYMWCQFNPFCALICQRLILLNLSGCQWVRSQSFDRCLGTIRWVVGEEGGWVESSGAVWKSRWTSWAPVPNKLTVSVDVKRHSTINEFLIFLLLLSFTMSARYLRTLNPIQVKFGFTFLFRFCLPQSVFLYSAKCLTITFSSWVKVVLLFV